MDVQKKKEDVYLNETYKESIGHFWMLLFPVKQYVDQNCIKCHCSE